MRLHLIPVAIVALLLAPRAAAASNFTVTPTRGQPLGVGDQRARHVAQWQQAAAAIRSHARQLVRRRARQDGADSVVRRHVLSQAGRARRRRVAQHPHRHQRRRRPATSNNRSACSSRSSRISRRRRSQRGGPAHQDWHPGVRPPGQAFAGRGRSKASRSKTARCWRAFATPATCTSASIPFQSRAPVDRAPRSRRKDPAGTCCQARRESLKCR